MRTLAAGRLLEALEPDPVERRRAARVDACAQDAIRPPRAAASSSSSAAVAVAVLEVDPQVLDRLALQLGQDPAEQVLVAVEHVEELLAVLDDDIWAWLPYDASSAGSNWSAGT